MKKGLVSMFAMVLIISCMSGCGKNEEQTSPDIDINAKENSRQNESKTDFDTVSDSMEEDTYENNFENVYEVTTEQFSFDSGETGASEGSVGEAYGAGAAVDYADSVSYQEYQSSLDKRQDEIVEGRQAYEETTVGTGNKSK